MYQFKTIIQKLQPQGLFESTQREPYFIGKVKPENLFYHGGHGGNPLRKSGSKAHRSGRRGFAESRRGMQKLYNP